jgi:hypothetical protein
MTSVDMKYIGLEFLLKYYQERAKIIDYKYNYLLYKYFWFIV